MGTPLNTEGRARAEQIADRLADALGLDPEDVMIDGSEGVFLTVAQAESLLERLEALR